MKKLLFVAAMLGIGISSVQAQVAYEKAKAFDNIYLGIEGGATTNLTFNHTFPLNGAAGIKLGKNFSPVFGANIEGVALFGDNNFIYSKNVVKAVNVGLNGTINFTNLFGEYRPDRTFEVGAEAGIGYLHFFGNKGIADQTKTDDDELSAKTALTFAWNLGEQKAWQVYVAPTIFWNLTGRTDDPVKFNKNYAQVGLFAGVNYKFKTSNGTHNFKVYDLTDMNNELNDLRAQLAAKPKEVVKEVVKEVPVAAATSQYFVTFAQGSSALSNEAKSILNDVKSGSRVQIIGTASPEGSKALNDKLSQARADVVANYLKSKGVTVESAVGKGVQGVTSNRLAIVYVK